ncbi:MAG: nucleotidyltransferase domain-containing protein [Proteobacteria bacterium]|nr:nucleotidyltransferase domain-containing protein [Pseudomonadota bacterium]
MLRKNLREKKVVAAYIFGSFAQKKEHLWSDLDLIIVIKDSSMPFIERPREFFDLLDIGIPMDILVYTLVEFTKMKTEENTFWKEIRSHLTQIVL